MKAPNAAEKKSVTSCQKKFGRLTNTLGGLGSPEVLLVVRLGERSRSKHSFPYEEYARIRISWIYTRGSYRGIYKI